MLNSSRIGELLPDVWKNVFCLLEGEKSSLFHSLFPF